MLIGKKLPFQKQLDSMDCGPSCLKMIGSFYNISVSIEYLRELCNTSRIGTSIGDIIHASKTVGLDALVFKTSNNYLKTNKPFPCILHWRKNHYVVLYSINKNRYVIADPGHGIISLNESEFLNDWLNGNEKGIAILFEPEYPKNLLNKTNHNTIQHSTFLQMVSYLKPYKKSIGLLIFFIFLSSLVSLFIPKTIQYMTDKGLSGKNMNVVWQILLLQLVLFVSLTLSNYIRNLIQTKLSTKLSVNIISVFLQKLLRLPISFFDTKNHADLYQRIDDHSKIESFLSNRLVSFIFSSVLVICYNTQLLLLNQQVVTLFIILTIVSFIWFFMFMEKRKNLEYRRFGLAIEERHYLHDLISGMTEIKLNSAESDKVNKWVELQAKLYSFKLSSLKVNNLQQNGISIINQVKILLVTFFCSYWVISNTISFGIMLSISYIIGQLAIPIQEIMTFFKDFQDAKNSFARLSEIQSKNDENKSKTKLFPNNFTSGINIKNISFKYPGYHNSYILKDIDIFIPKGKTTAIVGSSGSGKTTLLKLLLAFYEPQRGEIFFDNQDLSITDTDDYRKMCGVVMQDGFIYSTSIAQNVAMEEKSIDYKKVKDALSTACLWDFVETLPQKQNTLLGTVGVSLSGGQRQRLLIARAVYRNPHFIFLDEATNALDSNNEKKIMNNLEKFFVNKTVVVIAHRLSTVRNANQIIVLNNGVVDEFGTHEDLTLKRGKYYELVKNQLELGQ